ncbi:MAG: protein translocase subunit SecD [Lachnospiraceae bacterium]|nr:protein translocase subunit SecD [Lachnospiraceae bacterium]
MSKNRKAGKKNSGVLRLLATVLAIVLFAYIAVSGLGFEQSGSMQDIKLGLDLAGGVSITYQTVDENPSATDMADTIYKLQMRAQTYSSEAEVYQEGKNRINVDIPDVTDANKILEDLGQPGSLVFKDSEGKEVLTGADVKSAEAGIISKDNSGNSKDYVVNLAFTDAAAKTFAEVTKANIGKPISIVYDGEVVSNPNVTDAITGGKCYIEGMESYEAAEQLASTIRIGSLKLELKEMRSNVVGAKLGSDAISTSLKAGAIGLFLVMVFMIVFYLIPGIAAALALVLYVLLMICLLSAFQVTLTLPGIAGIVLTIGMAVDANVIIFSRIREELAAGKSVRIARKDGFSKALSAILDGNITTLIAALVLYLMGSGTVKGFATTLAIGTLLSMFTALFITRFILNGLYELGFRDPKFYGKKASMKQPPVIDFVSKKKALFSIAAVIIICGIAAMVYHGPVKGGDILNYSLEFKGGTSTSVTFNEDLSLDKLNSDVVPLISKVTGDNDIQVQKVSGSNQVIFKTRTLNNDERQELEDSLIKEHKIDQKQIMEESISATVSKEMKQDAIIAVLLSAVMMLIYIWFRFKDIRIAGSTVLCLLHDVLVVLTCYALLRWTVGNTFIACMLTVVGYSVNDTIVVFDRMRENLKLQKRGEGLDTVINKSLSQTLTRCLNTSITTGIMVLVLLVFGVASIREFALPLMVGICAGFFSSVCLAGNMWHTLKSMQKDQ